MFHYGLGLIVYPLRARRKFFLTAFLILGGATLVKASGEFQDILSFGRETSEKEHGFSGQDSAVVQGALNQPARRLLAPKKENWQGGTLAFRMKVDPVQQNYFTAKFSGSETNPNRLILFVEGKQVGYRHLGDYDLLDIGAKEPAYNGRFYYNTTPLPMRATLGKKEIGLEIRSSGPIYGYANTFGAYQKPMVEPSKAIYQVYTHTQTCFVPGADEKQGIAPLDPPVRLVPGPEVMDAVKVRLRKEIEGWLKSDKPLKQQEAQILGQAWHMAWTPAYQNPRALEKIAQTADAFYQEYKANPEVAYAEKGMYNPDWFGLGPIGDAIRQVGSAIQPMLNVKVGGKVRHEAWAEMLLASVEVHARNRRQYTNQSMITDMAIQWANEGLRAVDPAKAWPREKIIRYLHESIGIEPWLGSETDSGPAKPLGNDFYQITEKGLTKELGYVGYYGEVLDWVTHIYESTCSPGKPDSGDQRIRERLAKMEHARAYFRYPMLDADGNKAMRIETIIGWRDSYYPGDVCYAERTGWEGSPIFSVAATLDEQSVGTAQQMFEDNQFFAAVEGLLKQGGSRLSKTLLPVPRQYETLLAQPKSAKRLPMTPGQPDFAWADEENGVVVIKNGEDMIYASLYWRARYSVNFLARVHHLNPNYDRIAVVRQDCEWENSGLTYKRPNWVNFGFGNGGLPYPKDIESAHTGEELPVAKVPEGVPFKVGDENPYAGKASFYQLHYGRYLIGLNTTKDKEFLLRIPKELQGREWPELVSRGKIKAGDDVKVGPRSTVILDFGK